MAQPNPTIYNQQPAFLTSLGNSPLGQTITFGQTIDAELQRLIAKDRAEVEAQRQVEAARAVRLTAEQVAQRHGIPLLRVRKLTRQRKLPTERPAGTRTHYSYLTGAVDDAVAALRRPDGKLKGTRRELGGIISPAKK
jgi:hypothetical protein